MPNPTLSCQDAGNRPIFHPSLLCESHGRDSLFRAQTPIQLSHVFHAQMVRTSLALAGRMGITAAFLVLYVYGAEVFPTSLRTSGMGISSQVCGFLCVLGGYTSLCVYE